jgi:hypothetical protein
LGKINTLTFTEIDTVKNLISGIFELDVVSPCDVKDKLSKGTFRIKINFRGYLVSWKKKRLRILNIFYIFVSPNGVLDIGLRLYPSNLGR